MIIPIKVYDFLLGLSETAVALLLMVWSIFKHEVYKHAPRNGADARYKFMGYSLHALLFIQEKWEIYSIGKQNPQI